MKLYLGLAMAVAFACGIAVADAFLCLGTSGLLWPYFVRPLAGWPGKSRISFWLCSS